MCLGALSGLPDFPLPQVLLEHLGTTLRSLSVWAWVLCQDFLTDFPLPQVLLEYLGTTPLSPQSRCYTLLIWRYSIFVSSVEVFTPHWSEDFHQLFQSFWRLYRPLFSLEIPPVDLRIIRSRYCRWIFGLFSRGTAGEFADNSLEKPPGFGWFLRWVLDDSADGFPDHSAGGIPDIRLPCRVRPWS